MGLKSTIIKPLAGSFRSRILKDHSSAAGLQKKTLSHLLIRAKNTAFGVQHGFSEINDHSDFVERVPLSDYEDLMPYIERIKNGEKDVLWTSVPRYLAKTSGTTSGSKYIPISREAMPHFIKASWNALMCYVSQSGSAAFFDGKMIFLQGSPKLDKLNGIPAGRLSGIVFNHVPKFLHNNRLPTFQTNCIEDWETKVDMIVEETVQQDMRLISGIPPWIIMYFEKLIEASGKSCISEIFPNFQLLVHGGVNYRPYRASLEKLIGRQVDTIETYPASEGFIAYQDSLNDEGLLLNLKAGIFYEFIPLEDYFNENPSRIDLSKVETGVNYVIVLNTNSGLWGYVIGDTVKFTSVNPYRISVSGRIKHFLSAFGEHVIGEEVERAMQQVSEKFGLKISEYTVAPKIEVEGELPYHEWFVEFTEPPEKFDLVAIELDKSMCQQNTYYSDLIEGKILQPLKIRKLDKGVFHKYMKAAGKLGGQNKVARLSNNREIADALEKIMLQKI